MVDAFDLYGDDEVRRQMEALPKKVQNRVLAKAVRAGLKPVLAAARANAPRSKSKKNKYGKKLVKEIKIRTLKMRRNSGKGMAVSWKKPRVKNNDVFYALFQEGGWKAGKRRNKTRRRNTKRKIRRFFGVDTRRRVEGKAFIGRAARDQGRQSQSILRQMVRQGIESEARAL